MIELEQQEQQPLQQQLKQSVGHVYYNGIWRNWQVVHLIRLLSLSVHFFRYFAISYFLLLISFLLL